jgi:23S rRNA pseudouridine1911/1915/1917 synthase
MGVTTKTLTIAAETPPLLWKADRAVQALAAASRRQTTGMFDHDCVKVNGEPCSEPWRPLVVGDVVELRYDPAQNYSPKKKPKRPVGFDVLFEDEHLIIVIKPANCLTVPTPKGETNTLIQRVSHYLTPHGQRRRSPALGVHRLDRGVSGVLAFAKTDQAQSLMRSLFEAKKPEREYVAIVAGQPKPAAGTFRSLLASDKNFKRYTTTNENVGQLAITHYKTLEARGDVSVVSVRLETGRRNQIRVHFAEAGYPIIGDRLYGFKDAQHPRWTTTRIALHAKRLGFTHPITGEELLFEAPLPKEFRKFLAGETAGQSPAQPSPKRQARAAKFKSHGAPRTSKHADRSVRHGTKKTAKRKPRRGR